MCKSFPGGNFESVEDVGKSWSRGGQEERISLSDIGWFRSCDGVLLYSARGAGTSVHITGIRGERVVIVEVEVEGWS